MFNIHYSILMLFIFLLNSTTLAGTSVRILRAPSFAAARVPRLFNDRFVHIVPPSQIQKKRPTIA